MEKFTRALIFLSLSLIAGCATTQARREYDQMQKNMAEASSKMNACTAKLKSIPSTQIVYDKLQVHQENGLWTPNRFELTRSKEYLSDDLRNHFITYLIEREKCDKILLDGTAQTHSRLFKRLAESFNAVASLNEQLLDRKITVGEFNSRLIEIATIASQDLSVIDREIVSNLLSRHNSEVEQFANEWSENYQRELDRQSRERAANSQNPRAYQLPLPRSYQSNCYRIGNNIHCTTQ